ncbi:hypothetical protein NQ317_016654 [Molorchus minor]|uniref:Uncharacterized protein n=1 Tax=Molorchus minor TaxID=1323400 RepID=A0ABQ9JQ31_9CUCU|nr:hypothetical protein NQ317_016654 [Molorchus minor]
MNEIDEDNSQLDPRIQIELEKLNSTTDEINRLEIEYDEANTTFSMLLNESTRRLKLLSKKLGSCIEKARIYYDLLDDAKKAQQECQEAAALNSCGSQRNGGIGRTAVFNTSARVAI